MLYFSRILFLCNNLGKKFQSVKQKFQAVSEMGSGPDETGEEGETEVGD